MGMPCVICEAEDFKVKQRAQVDWERTVRTKDAFLHPNITAGPELLFSHFHHNSFILTALRWEQVRTNLHLSGSIGDMCMCESVFASTQHFTSLALSDLAPPFLSLTPQSFGNNCISRFSLFFFPSVSIYLSLSHPLSLQLVTLSLFCFFSLDVPAQLTHTSSQAEHTCV